MPLYNFTPVDDGGRASTSICAHLPHDLAALRYASEVSARRPSAVRISVSEGGRHVAHVPGPGEARGQASALDAVLSSRARIVKSLSLLRGLDDA
jgi:hypothetical protein